MRKSLRMRKPGKWGVLEAKWRKHFKRREKSTVTNAKDQVR